MTNEQLTALKVEVWASTARELMLQIFVFAHRGKLAHLGGKGWVEATEKAISPELAEAWSRIGGQGSRAGLWMTLGALSYGARATSVAQLLTALETLPADDLLLDLCGYNSLAEPPAGIEDLMRAAARGDSEAGEELRVVTGRLGMDWQCELYRIALPLNVEEVRAGLLHLIRLWHRDLFAEREESLNRILVADAARIAARSAFVTPQELVDEATNGLELAPDQLTDRVVLAPSWIMRPFASDSRQGRTLIVDYPVCDECFFDSPDEAAISRVLTLTRVLSDEVRLRALRRVAQEPSTLQQLADHVGIGKSTMHHHIAAMRGAGLLRVRMGTKVYSLRREALEELPRGLSGFLGSEK